MVLWLGGPFGAGKTTTGRLLAAGDPTLCLFDPEWVGYLLREHLPVEGVTDFQQWPSWRRLVPVVGDELARATGAEPLAVQTVLVEEYWHELVAGFGALGHDVRLVVLHADDDELRRRIEADEVEVGARAWRLRHLEVFARARSWLLPAAQVVVDTTGRAPDEVAAQVREQLGRRSSIEGAAPGR